MKLHYRPLFLTDVEECADDLASEANEAVAAAWHQALKKSLQLIQAAPEIGRVRRDLPVPDVRTLNLRRYPNYLIFYRLEKAAIELLRVRHGMMHLAELFSK